MSHLSNLQAVGDTVTIVDNVEDWPAEVVQEESNEWDQHPRDMCAPVCLFLCFFVLTE